MSMQKKGLRGSAFFLRYIEDVGAEARSSQNELRVDLSMWRKIIELLKENEMLRGSVLLAGTRNSQNLSLG